MNGYFDNIAMGTLNGYFNWMDTFIRVMDTLNGYFDWMDTLLEAMDTLIEWINNDY